MRSKTIISITTTGVLAILAGLGLWLLVRYPGAPPATDSVAPVSAVPIVSTRGHLSGGELTAGHGRYDYDLPAELPGLTPDTIMPFDLLVIVPGFNDDPAEAEYSFSAAQEALRRNGYTGRLVGFGWDAGAPPGAVAAAGSTAGDTPADLNGPKLARFLLDYRAKCPVTRLHVVGCAQGARVVLECLVALDEDRGLNALKFRVDSVHLVGAAVDNREVERGGRYGAAIERRTKALLNYYSPADPALAAIYPPAELDHVLGANDLAHPENRPAGCESVDVSSELVTADDAGDSPAGYLGRLDAAGNLRDDGVMNLITAWIRGRDDN